ncbi:MAG: thioredoxin domain-containing protein [Micromonosporaceae bacterium]|nr:thioredoxin domain-containing protein [Micromonosporaceae bacterium]
MSKRYSQKQAAAKVVREQLAKERRRRRQLWTALGAVVAIAVAGAAGWLVYSSQEDDRYNTPPGTYSDDQSKGLAFAVGEGPHTIEVFSDYQCPICRSVETATRDTFDQWVAAKKVKIIQYPVAVLDNYSKNEYSTRAAAAAGCAAEGGKFHEYNHALYVNQPAENTAGPSDAELIEMGKTVGLGDSFGQCVKDGKYKTWTKQLNRNFENRKLRGTPTIFVDGKQMTDPSIANLTAAIGG